MAFNCIIYFACLQLTHGSVLNLQLHEMSGRHHSTQQPCENNIASENQMTSQEPNLSTKFLLWSYLCLEFSLSVAQKEVWLLQPHPDIALLKQYNKYDINTCAWMLSIDNMHPQN